MAADLLMKKLERVKKKCNSCNIRIHLTISLDGINVVHEQTRGIKGSFKKTFHTLMEISENKNKYCDYLDVGYTISKGNVTDMVAVKQLLASIKVKPYYHIAVPNRRIYTFEKNDYSILDNFRMVCLAREFFYSEFITQKDIKTKLKSYVNYYYLKSSFHKREALCNYLWRDITIDENLNVYLCATASNKVGNLKEASMTEIVQKKQLDREAYKIEHYCEHCIHYASVPTMKGAFLFVQEKFAKVNLILDLICARLHF